MKMLSVLLGLFVLNLIACNPSTPYAEVKKRPEKESIFSIRYVPFTLQHLQHFKNRRERESQDKKFLSKQAERNLLMFASFQTQLGLFVEDQDLEKHVDVVKISRPVGVETGEIVLKLSQKALDKLVEAKYSLSAEGFPLAGQMSISPKDAEGRTKLENAMNKMELMEAIVAFQVDSDGSAIESSFLGRTGSFYSFADLSIARENLGKFDFPELKNLVWPLHPTAKFVFSAKNTNLQEVFCNLESLQIVKRVRFRALPRL